jgi:hypothetical protein
MRKEKSKSEIQQLKSNFSREASEAPKLKMACFIMQHIIRCEAREKTKKN